MTSILVKMTHFLSFKLNHIYIYIYIFRICAPRCNINILLLKKKRKKNLSIEFFTRICITLKKKKKVTNLLYYHTLRDTLYTLVFTDIHFFIIYIHSIKLEERVGVRKIKERELKKRKGSSYKGNVCTGNVDDPTEIIHRGAWYIMIFDPRESGSLSLSLTMLGLFLLERLLWPPLSMPSANLNGAVMPAWTLPLFLRGFHFADGPPSGITKPLLLGTS